MLLENNSKKTVSETWESFKVIWEFKLNYNPEC